VIEKLLFWTGCFPQKPFLFSFVAFAVPPFVSWDNLLIFGLFQGFILFNTLYYALFAKSHMEAFKEVLIQKGFKELGLDPERTKVLTLPKKSRKCFFPFLKTAWETQLSFIYLGEENLTIYTKCPPYRFIKPERKGFEDKFQIKDSCGKNVEYYYSYIQTVFFDGGNIYITLNSGDQEILKCDKKPAKNAVKQIRAILREKERRWQTLPKKERL